MADEQNYIQSIIDEIISFLGPKSWSGVFTDVLKSSRNLIQRHFPKGSYEVLEYESTLELLNREGTKATFSKREQVRYLQDNVIAYQDQAWGDGKILIDYRCKPGTPVDTYRLGHKTHILISRREVKNRRDVDEYNIEWSIDKGFLRKTEQWETHVKHPTKHLKINVIFPKSRPPQSPVLIESNRQRSHKSEREAQTQLPDGRWQISWETDKPRLYENYILQWEW